MSGRHVSRWELDGVSGAVVVVDVLRAFTTAAYALAAGADAIYVVADVGEALELKEQHPGWLAVGEDRGRLPHGFDFPNSPAAVQRSNLEHTTLIQRTSAGTQGVVAARDATRLWAASLACASATARQVRAADLGDPTYVITGQHADSPPDQGDDDRLTADLIERVRIGRDADAAATATALCATREAQITLALGPPHCDPLDIELASRVDAFQFAMEVHRDEIGHRLEVARDH